MKKFFLYGNCQLSVIANWLLTHDFVKILRPEDYNIKSEKPWQKYAFFPRFCTTKDTNSVLRGLNEADYFIFHDINNPEFLQSLFLYNECRCKKLCITNFYFDPFQSIISGVEKHTSLKDIEDKALADILELKKREKIMCDKYGTDVLSLVDFIEKNWRDKALNEKIPNHPSKFYNLELTTRLKNGLLKECNLNLEHILNNEKFYGGTPKHLSQKILNVFPRIRFF